jgi:hypothetical protein
MILTCFVNICFSHARTRPASPHSH